MPNLIDAKGAAKLLDVKLNTFYRLAKKQDFAVRKETRICQTGQIHHVKMFDKQALQKFAETYVNRRKKPVVKNTLTREQRISIIRHVHHKFIRRQFEP